MQKNFLSKRKNFALNKEEFRLRQMRALQIRHDQGMTDKVIARAINVHADTVGNWRTGITEIKARDMLALDNYLASTGDWLFLEHLCGELAVRRRLRADQLEQQAAQLRKAADFFGNTEAQVA